MHADVLRAINVQINSELTAWYQYREVAQATESRGIPARDEALRFRSGPQRRRRARHDRAAGTGIRIVRRGLRTRAQAGTAGDRADQLALRAGVQVEGVRRDDRASVVSDRTG